MAPRPAQGSVPLVDWQAKNAALLMAGQGFGVCCWWGAVLALLYWKTVISLVVGIRTEFITLTHPLIIAMQRGIAKGGPAAFCWRCVPHR
jgi:hypothetical protein